MDTYFSSQGEGGSFPLFSASHIWAMGIIFGINVLLYFHKDRISSERLRKSIRLGLSFILILQEITFNLWNVKNGLWSIACSLPLQLCGISAILSSIMLIKKSYKLFEILYFWGIGGALQAVITPELGNYTYPHFRYLQFFLCHGAIITSCLYMTFVEGYSIGRKSMWKAFMLLNIYAAFIGVFNMLTGANYLFLCHKPYISSLMDYLGPWPWYILSLEAAALLVFFILLKAGSLLRKK